MEDDNVWEDKYVLLMMRMMIVMMMVMATVVVMILAFGDWSTLVVSVVGMW